MGDDSIPPVPNPTQNEGGGVPNWLNPNNIPPWVYFLGLFLGGGGATALNFSQADGDAKSKDIERLERKFDKLDQHLQALDARFTELRITIVRYHATDDLPDPP